jgi:hypothetical protein
MAYGNMFLFSIIGFLASGTFLGRAYFDYYFSIVACLVILKRVCEAEWRANDEAPDEEEDLLEEPAQERSSFLGEAATGMRIQSTLA